MNIKKLLICCSLSLLLSACTGMLWTGNKVSDTRTVLQIQIKDNITDVLQYQNLAVSALQEQQQIPLDIPSEGIAFLGEKNIYILTEGAAQLLALDKLSVRLPLAVGLHGDKEPIKMRLEPDTRKSTLMHFRNRLLVRVVKRDAAFSTEELKAIAQSGFKAAEGEYIKRIQVSGVILPKKNLNYAFSQKAPLTKSREIEFYSANQTTQLHPLNLATNIVFTPLAVAADIVFLPVSLGLLKLISNANSR